MPEVPSFSEETWLGMAVAFAVFSLIGLAYAFWWVFLDTAVGIDMGERSRAVTPFLAAGVAAVTFFSVLWRGAISSRQADENQRQNDSREEADLALLFEKAAALLTDEKLTNRSYAIAMLDTIVLAQNGKYASYGLEMLADEFSNLHYVSGPVADRLLAGIRRTFTEANALGRRMEERFWHFRSFEDRGPAKDLLLDHDGSIKRSGSQQHALQLVAGISASVIANVEISADDETVDFLNKLSGAYVSRVIVSKPSFSPSDFGIVVDDKYDGCVFEGVKISKVMHDRFSFDEIFFFKCDFTAAKFESEESLKRCHFQKCTFDAAAPPIFEKPGEFITEEFLSELGILSRNKRNK